MTTIDQIIAEKIGEFYIGEWPIGNLILCLIALLLCVVLCGAIGIEREMRGRGAGLRTHLLVGMGSCIIMIISIYGFPVIKVGETVFNRDVARLAAQVIAGVGFLGAGTIIHRNSGAKGLTTAATIWLVMAIGLACGSMNFVLAIVGTILIIVVLTLFRRFEDKLNSKEPLVTLIVKPNAPIVSHLLEVAQKCDYSVQDIQLELLENGRCEVTFLAISNYKGVNVNDFIAKLENMEEVEQVGLVHSHKN